MPPAPKKSGEKKVESDPGLDVTLGLGSGEKNKKLHVGNQADFPLVPAGASSSVSVRIPWRKPKARNLPDDLYLSTALSERRNSIEKYLADYYIPFASEYGQLIIQAVDYLKQAKIHDDSHVLMSNKRICDSFSEILGLEGIVTSKQYKLSEGMPFFKEYEIFKPCLKDEFESSVDNLLSGAGNQTMLANVVLKVHYFARKVYLTEKKANDFDAANLKIYQKVKRSLIRSIQTPSVSLRS